MTTQEAYEKIRAYFSRPGAQLSKSDSDACYYRHPDDGRACAVGCLIPDEVYDPSMEQTAADSLLTDTDYPLGNLFPDDDTVTFLMNAQHDHDRRATDATDFITLLDHRARLNNLDVVTS